MFIANYPAMKVRNALIIADIHLGITKDARDRGINLPSQVDSFAKRINVLKKKTRTKKLILLGDVKHGIITTWQEKKEIPEFFEQIRYKDIILVKGNHDGLIEKIVPEKVRVVKSYSYGIFVFTHGHRNIETKKKWIVIGHNQPHVMFRDCVGALYTEPVWVKGPLKGKMNGKKIVMMPGFNELSGATVVNSDELLGPMAKTIDKKKARCYLLDGTYLGTIASLSGIK